MTSSLHDAALAGDLIQLRLLLDGGADVNQTNEFRSTALLYAAKVNQLEAAMMLIERGAHVNIANSSKTTALHCAASSGHLAMCELLLDKGADLRCLDEDCDSPIDVAEEGGWPEVCNFLTSARYASAMAELRHAMRGGDARQLAVDLERAEDEELVPPQLLSEARDRLEAMRNPTGRSAEAVTDVRASDGATAQTAELEVARQALAEATAQLQLEGEARARLVRCVAAAGALVAVGLLAVLALSGRRQPQRR